MTGLPRWHLLNIMKNFKLESKKCCITFQKYKETQNSSSFPITSRLETRSTGDWFADSGATQHMSDQKEWLVDFVTVPDGSWNVDGIGSAKCSVRGYGDVNIWTEVNGDRKPAIIKKVLYVPGLGINLFSIAAATDLGWKVTFVDTMVHISSEENTKIIVGERVGRNLYLLAIQARYKEEPTSFALPSSVSPAISTWHRRLAHLNYHTIVKMASSDVVEGLDLANKTIPPEPCNVCAFGKHQRAPVASSLVTATPRRPTAFGTRRTEQLRSAVTSRLTNIIVLWVYQGNPPPTTTRKLTHRPSSKSRRSHWRPPVVKNNLSST